MKGNLIRLHIASIAKAKGVSITLMIVSKMFNLMEKLARKRTIMP